MGVLDHRRTWHYELNATPDQCVEAFRRAFKGKGSGGLLAKADWDVVRTGKGAKAVYQGRKGIGAVGSIISGTSAHEADTAVGSEVTFEVESGQGNRTTCSMWLGASGRAGIGGLLGVTSDARFIRPYMQAVEKEMRALDSSARVSTG